MRQGIQSRGARQKKLNPKAGQPILREDQIDSAEYDSLQNPTKVTSAGVEEGEFEEVHLQAALAGQSKGENDGEIPAPPAEETADFDYDSLYSLVFHQPNTYIAFSQTIEESNGCAYDMTTEDDVFLKSYNTKKPVVARCSEDVFEKIMESFEKTAAEQSPFASVDNTVLSFDEMKGALRQEGKPQVEDKILKFAQDIYEHWKIRRQGSGNKPLQPTLKVETHQENDEADPYVCFRRREVRQTRKTRARDIQSTERLRKLRKELEEGRYLLVLTQQREKLKARMRKAEQNVFEKRAKVKDTKVKLGIKTDDEDLINQKPQKRRASEYPMARPPPAHRLPGRIDGRPMDADLQLLSAIQEDKENILRQEIEVKVHQHRKWNAEHVDVTREPLEQVLGLGSEMAFRPAAAQYQYLITPPSSLNSFDETVQEKVEQNAISFRAGSPSPSEDDQMAHPAYRRRMGRGGRLWIDRRGMPSVDTRAVDTTSDRWKFDQDDDEEQPVYEKDPYDTNAIRFRASIPFSPHIYQQRGGRGELAPRPASNNRAIAGPPQPQPPT